MFTSNFANDVITPAAQGQPLIISGPMHLAIRIILVHPAIFNTCFALIQLGLGTTILWKRTAKWGLIASVFWGLAVWFGGEGLAGIASGHSTLLMGAPGAALIYTILALAVLPPKKTKSEHDSQPAYWLVAVWAILWVGGAIFQLLPGQNSVSDISSMITGNADGAPGWLASLDNHVGNAINNFGVATPGMAGMHMTASQMNQMYARSSSGYWFISLLAAMQLFIGLAIFMPSIIRKFAIALGIILSLVFWFVGQSLGAYFSGLATDPNSAPLFILLGVAILGCTNLDEELSRFVQRCFVRRRHQLIASAKGSESAQTPSIIPP